jgi:hypothetical protein
VNTFSVKALISLTRTRKKWPNPRSRATLAFEFPYAVDVIDRLLSDLIGRQFI